MSNIDPEYIPQFCMPIIEPPTQGDPSTYYQNLGLNATATQLSDNTNGIKYVATRDNGDTGLFDHYLLMDSLIHFVKAGSNFPGWGSLAGTTCSKNTLLIKPNPVANEYLIKKLPSGIPPPIIMIENVEESSFTQDLTAYIHKALNNNYWPYIHSMMTILLDDTWSEINGSDPAQASLNDKINLFINQVINSGDYWFFLKGSSKLGKILNNASNEAEFNIKMLDTSMLDYITPVAFLRQMITLPDSSAGTKWTDHPLISSIESFSTPVDIYLKFEIWNPLSVTDSNEPHYVPVDANCEVRVQQYIENSNDITGDTAYTNADGEVLFHYNSLPDVYFTSETPNIYFEIINPACAKIDEFNIDADEPLMLPDKWSTKPNASNTDNWLSVDGSEGYYENFKGIKLGRSSAPLTYRIGVDYHLEMMYTKDSDVPFPKGIAVCIFDSSKYHELLLNINSTVFKSIIDKEKSLTDEFGIVHGITFNLKPNLDLGFLIYYEIHNPDIGINSSRINIAKNSTVTSEYHWGTFQNDQDANVLYSNQLNTIGSFNSPYSIIATKKNNRVAGLYVAKIMTELAYFFDYFTNGTWPGFDTIKVNTGVNVHEKLSSHSLPMKIVDIKEESNFDRDTILHELCHQIMYEEISGTGWDLVKQTLGMLPHVHSLKSVTNIEFAFYEGWTAAIEKILCGTLNTYSSLTDIEYGSFTRENQYKTNSLTPLPYNTGQRVEGAYGNMISFIFWKYVVGEFFPFANKDYPNLKESKNGNLSITNPWLKNNRTVLSSRFLNYIFNSFQLLDKDNATTIGHFSGIINSFSGIKKLKLFSDFYRWNSCYINAPILKGVSTISTSSIDSNKNIELKIKASNLIIPDVYNNKSANDFFDGRLEVYNMGVYMKILCTFNEDTVFSVDIDEVINEDELKFTMPPLNTGTYDLSIEITIRKGNTSDGYKLLSNKIQINVG